MSLQDQLDQLDNKKCLLIGAVIAIIYYFFSFDEGQNIKSQIKTSHDELAQKQKEIDKIDASMKNKEKFELENKKLFENMKEFERYFTPSITSNVLLKKISEYAEQSSTIVNSLNPGQPYEEFPDYLEKVIFIDISGQYHNLMDFISKLTHMKRVVNFEDMTLKVENEGNTPIVNLKMDLVVYNIKSTDDSTDDSEQNKDGN